MWRFREMWRLWFHKEHNTLKAKDRAARLKAKENIDPSDLCYTDITDIAALEEVRDCLLDDHIHGSETCPWPNICCHTNLVNDFINSVRAQGRELKQLRQDMEWFHGEFEAKLDVRSEENEDVGISAS